MTQVFAISVYLDGDQWCALIGNDLQSGTSGWGKIKEAAIADLAKVLQEIKDRAK